MYVVYKHTTPSGKVYIGITGLKPERRWRNGNGYKDNEHFYRAILKYGWDNIKHEIDLRVQQHQHFKKILDNFPNVPEGYTGWFEIEKIPL